MPKTHSRDDDISRRRHTRGDEFCECRFGNQRPGGDAGRVRNDELNKPGSGGTRAETGDDGRMKVMAGPADDGNDADGTLVGIQRSRAKRFFQFVWQIHIP
jgi:hypothetical protein